MRQQWLPGTDQLRLSGGVTSVQEAEKWKRQPGIDGLLAAGCIWEDAAIQHKMAHLGLWVLAALLLALYDSRSSLHLTFIPRVDAMRSSQAWLSNRDAVATATAAAPHTANACPVQHALMCCPLAKVGHAKKHV